MGLVKLKYGKSSCPFSGHESYLLRRCVHVMLSGRFSGVVDEQCFKKERVDRGRLGRRSEWLALNMRFQEIFRVLQLS